MSMTRRGILAVAVLAAVAACARPASFTPTGPGSEIHPVSLKAEDVVIDVSGLTAPDDVLPSLELYGPTLAIEEAEGRPVRAIVNIHDFDFVDGLVSSVTGSHSSLTGEVALEDLSTGERLFVSEVIRVDSRSIAIPDFTRATRDRPGVKAASLSKLFMERARQTLLAPNT